MPVWRPPDASWSTSPTLQDDALGAAIRDTGAQVLIVRGTKVTADMLEGNELGLIVRAGAGYNTIDVAAASARGIAVSNCPGKNAIAVAELTLGLILALDRRIPDNVADLRAGRWNKKEYAKAAGLKGRTLGLIGFGSIAREVATRAQAFGMHVLAWSRSFGDGNAVDFAAFGLSDITAATSAAEVIDAADIVSIHVALAPETRGLVDAALIARLKPGAFLINTSRAEVVDHDALAAAVRERGIRVGLDVYPDEPTSATADYYLDLLELPGRLRHPPHRRIHRPGAGRRCCRDGADRAVVHRDRPGSEHRERRPARTALSRKESRP